MKKKILLFIFIIILVYAIGGIIFWFLNRKPEVVRISNLDSISGYNYNLKSNDKELYKSEFKILKKNLESNEINKEEYAKSISKMFIIDLYTLNNKINKYEIGGEQFVYPDAVENFKLNVQNTIYKYLEDNSNNFRKQELPEVSNVTINNIENIDYTIKDQTFKGYKVKLSWEYVKDLGYDKEGELILVIIDKNIYIVEKN